MPTIIFTGGGTAGHVTPNLALMKALQKDNWQIHYVGANNSIEQQLVTAAHFPFHAISTGKLHRRLTLKNLLTPWQVLKGCVQSYILCRQLKAHVVFSKGGFVAFPVIVGAWLNRIPIIAHESDLSPGLATRLSFPFAKKMCLTFDGGKQYFKQQHKIVVTGTPVRDELLQGDPAKGLAHCGFNTKKPVLMIFGGSLGALTINQVVRAALGQLLEKFQVIHICGKGKVDASFNNLSGYQQFEYVNEPMGDIMACADLIIARSGANSLYELLTLKKPHILIPFAKARGDHQMQNAQYFAEQGLSQLISESDLTAEHLIHTVMQLWEQRETIQLKLNQHHLPNSTTMITQLIEELSSAP